MMPSVWVRIVGMPSHDANAFAASDAATIEGVADLLGIDSRARSTPQACLTSTMDAAPVDRLNLVTPYPHGMATNTQLSLKEITAGRPCVLHLFTG